MARLTGPLFSESASGLLRGVLSYSHSPNGPRVALLRRAARPHTGWPAECETAVTLLSLSWKLLLPQDRALWDSLKPPDDPSPYHHYIRVNLRHLLDRRAPTSRPNQTFTTRPHPTGSTRCVSYNYLLYVIEPTTNDGYGVKTSALYRLDTPNTPPTPGQLSQIRLHAEGIDKSFILPKPPVGKSEYWAVLTRDAWYRPILPYLYATWTTP
jgi:hypothetical protein